MAIGEWDERQLCPDGACIGVIGPDGTCKTCGRAAPNWGDERKRGLIEPEDQNDEDEDEGDIDDDDADDDADDDEGEIAGDGDGTDGNAADDRAASDQGPTARGDWTARRLCPDGGCIGVIGIDGRCKVCGRTAEGPANERRPAGPAATDAMAPAPAEPSAEPADADAAAAAQASATPDATAPPSPTSPLREFLEGVPTTEPAAAAADSSPDSSSHPHEPCPDASCKGRIGGDGRCDVCGNGAS